MCAAIKAVYGTLVVAKVISCSEDVNFIYCLP